jgi:hypothetical protein
MNMRKRGIEMAVTTVIMIVLSIVILTILVVFVNSQTGFLSKWFSGQQSESNVDLIISSCNALVATDSVYSYCCEKKEIIFGDGGVVDSEGNVVKKGSVRMTCNTSRGEGWAAGRIKELSCEGVSC